MKKLVFSVMAIASLAFVGCSNDDDDDDNSSCATCSIDFLGTPITSEYCDNGDGTITVTTQGVSQTEDLDGVTFAQFISAFEVSGLGSCN